MRWHEWLFAFLIAGAAGAVAAVLLLPGVSPDAWTGFCEATGVRPPENAFPGVWRMLAYLFVQKVGPAEGAKWLRLAGPATTGLLAFMFYLTTRMMLPRFLNFSSVHPIWERVLIRVTVLLATLTFVFSAPVMALTQAFTADVFHLLLALIALCLIYQFLWSVRTFWLYLGLVLCGVLTVETPLGLAMTVVYAAFIRYVIYLERSDTSLKKEGPKLSALKWRLTFTHLASACFTFAADLNAFDALGGKTETGQDIVSWVLRWGLDLAHNLSGVTTTGGWLMLALFGVAVAAVSWAVLPRATNDERQLPYGIGWVYIGFGGFAFAQLTTYDVLRYVTWFGGEGVRISPILCSFAALFAAVALTAALTVLMVELFCRTAVSLRDDDALPVVRMPLVESLKQRFVILGLPVVRKAFAWARLSWLARLLGKAWRARPKNAGVHFKAFAKRHRRFFAWVLPLAIAACVLPARIDRRPAEVHAALADYLDLVLEESAGVDCLVTDGHFDEALELLAKTRGKRLIAHRLLGKTTDYDRTLRLRGEPDSEDRAVLEVSTAAALRNWVEERTNRLETVGVQVGFEMWRRQRREVPCAGGTMVRVTWPEQVAEHGRERARSLAERMLGLYRAKGVSRVDRRFRNLFDEAAWRLARIARLRAQTADRARDVTLAKAEQHLADELDEANLSVQAMNESLGNVHADGSTLLSPREGLKVALARPDFRLARRFATPVLAVDPDDPDANFGVGMAYLMDEQWTRAEECLKRVLKRRPNEPAVFNNLAGLYYKTGKFKEAEKWAKKAAELLPDSPEVRETLRTIQRKIK